MQSIYGSTMSNQSSGDAQATGTPLRRQTNPSGSGGFSGGFSNGGGYNTEGSQPSSGASTGFSAPSRGGSGAQSPRWGGVPQSSYAQSSPYAASGMAASGRASSYARPAEGASPNESMAAAQARQQAAVAPQESGGRYAMDPGQRSQEADARAQYVASGQADYNPYPGASMGVPPVGAGAGSMGAAVYQGPSVAPPPMPAVAPLPSTTASPDQLMSARFNVPGLTPALGQPQPPLVAPQEPRRLPSPVVPQSTYGGMFAR